ncbi:isoquinoline 1-oxidoreductase alpha subunit [Povalibacter uvarum]|uniref:Isoquinoline 1-oxidoreductase alpha subunit n=1 Tax=Povalibacter uvarum TaxID=732238 RepID=A0A841HI55_9GAMM|nr:(2Fe-2S)-binding protein [Povalibacter uvarum]MBB6092254.1 isoquinoline 1-oxidoreductase alpha subunit [Povalibacter uvarum]
MPQYVLKVNGDEHVIDAPNDMPLLYVLRDRLGITGPKYGCGVGICGACTSHVGNSVARPCIVRIDSVGAQEVTTIEGLATGDVLHPVQQAWIDEDVAQCGFCQPGQIMTAVALLAQIANPTDADIDAAMSENVCRCGTYVRIRAAIKRAAAALQQA